MLIVAIALFAAFALNVTVGAFTHSPFLSDIQEMLLLFVASAAFVAAVLKREADVQTDNAQRDGAE